MCTRWSFFNLHPWQKPFQEADKNPESQITNPKSKKQKSRIPNPQILNVVYVYKSINWFILCYVCLQKSNLEVTEENHSRPQIP